MGVLEGWRLILWGNRLFSLYCHSVTADTSRNTQPRGLTQVNSPPKRRLHTRRGFIFIYTHRDKGDVYSIFCIINHIILLLCRECRVSDAVGDLQAMVQVH